MKQSMVVTKRTILLQAYAKARTEGIDEIGEVLLSISSDLLSFNFRETFVNAFDVRHAFLSQ